MVLIDVLDEMVTLVTPVLLKVAVFIGTLGGIQLPAVFQSLVAPFHVASCVCAAFGTRIANAPKQTLASSAARLRGAGADVIAIRIALPRIAARGAAGAAACVGSERHRYERIPQPLRAAPAAHPIIARAVPRGRIVAPRPTLRAERLRSIRGRASRRGLPPPVAFPPRGLRRDTDSVCAREGVRNDLTRVTRIFQRM